MKNKILIIYALTMLPFLKLVNKFKKTKLKIDIINDNLDFPDRDTWDSYFKHVIVPVEIRKERLFSNERTSALEVAYKS